MSDGDGGGTLYSLNFEIWYVLITNLIKECFQNIFSLVSSCQKKIFLLLARP